MLCAKKKSLHWGAPPKSVSFRLVFLCRERTRKTVQLWQLWYTHARIRNLRVCCRPRPVDTAVPINEERGCPTADWSFPCVVRRCLRERSARVRWYPWVRLSRLLSEGVPSVTSSIDMLTKQTFNVLGVNFHGFSHRTESVCCPSCCLRMGVGRSVQVLDFCGAGNVGGSARLWYFVTAEPTAKYRIRWLMDDEMRALIIPLMRPSSCLVLTLAIALGRAFCSS